jgi:hypothetical protein
VPSSRRFFLRAGFVFAALAILTGFFTAVLAVLFAADLLLAIFRTGFAFSRPAFRDAALRVAVPASPTAA